MRIAVALLVLAIVAGCGTSDEQTAPLSGESLEGEAISLGDFRGRPVMVNVWSSW